VAQRRGSGFVQSGFSEVALTTHAPGPFSHATSQNPQDSQISFSMIHGWSAFGGPTMVGRTLDWKEELGRWLKPFLDRLGHKARRQMCPLYVSGLIGLGDRKSRKWICNGQQRE
jgi:hypothetical protein